MNQLSYLELVLCAVMVAESFLFAAMAAAIGAEAKRRIVDRLAKVLSTVGIGLAVTAAGLFLTNTTNFIYGVALVVALMMILASQYALAQNRYLADLAARTGSVLR